MKRQAESEQMKTYHFCIFLQSLGNVVCIKEIAFFKNNFMDL